MGITYSDTQKDLPSEQLHRLFMAAGWSDGTETGNRKAHFNMPFINSTLVVSAWDNERLVGAARVLSDGIVRSMLHDVIVDAEYQNRGIGRELLKRCMARYPDSEWLVSATEKASGFYRKLGFCADDRIFLTVPSKYF